MRGCQNGALTEEEERRFLYTEDTHKQLTVVIENYWQLLELDPLEEENDRDDQLAFCGRQGHQQIEGLLDMSVPRFRRLYQSIIRQLEKENEAAERARKQMEMER